MDLEKIYSEGKAVSHTAGLAAVFEAGRQSMIPIIPEPVAEQTPEPVQWPVIAPLPQPKKKTKKNRGR